MIDRIDKAIFIGITHITKPLFPELQLAGFGFLTHFVWEMIQVPWFVGMAEASHGSVVWLCIRATGGDVLILLSSYWLASIIFGNRRWLIEGELKPAVILVATGLLVTIVLEWLATGPLERWVYVDSMPIIPLVNVGLAPLLQWVLLPPLIMWLARRHILGSLTLKSNSSA